MTRLRRIGVYYRSLRHLPPAMLYWRLHRSCKSACIGVMERTGLASLIPGETRNRVACRPMTEPGSVYHCEDISLVDRRFTFLNETVTLPSGGKEIVTAVRACPLLWRYHFAYHDYLVALLQADALSPEDALAFIEGWRADFPLTAPGARRAEWHAYVLSIRIEAWIRVYLRSRAAGFGAEDPRLRSLAAGIEHMTRVLLRNLERGTRANHLLKNIKALILAGRFLDHPTGAAAWRKGLALLDREIPEQVLTDGMHFERSPMYHTAMTSDLFDLCEVLDSGAGAARAMVRNAARRMTAFLARSLHPDGEFPFLNDSTASFFLPSADVLRRGLAAFPDAAGEAAVADPQIGQGIEARIYGTALARHSGLAFYRDQNLFLVFDAGDVGPDYQPGHAHCDTLGFELSWLGRRVFTDTGVSHYRESPEREWSRSTAAHNTVRIDGGEQSEVWKSFRVGRRARALFLERRIQGGCEILQGAHDGYARTAPGIVHERAMVIAPRRWICIVDFLHGAGTHLAEHVFHLHPGYDCAETNDRFAVTLPEGIQCVVEAAGISAHRILQTEYYPAFGVKRLRKTLVLSSSGTVPRAAAFLLCFEGSDPLPRAEIDGMNATITEGDARFHVASRLGGRFIAGRHRAGG